ncbi:MAG: iron ABC transporter permease [Bacteroidales bacterium]|nr:iron ABC transporter permease [Bacteroidales bacterium]MCM1415298.1 iron ABC transporter permease [bacterium]MCM1423454.1 iron ABC transporter permease [bacterium]
MSTGRKMGLLLLLALCALLLGVGAGSVSVPPGDILAILAERLMGRPLPEHLPASYSVMILDMRLPRVLLAFLTGAALSVGGAVMQSVLQNPLASPFGLGVSSGAGLGAALVIVLGLTSAGIRAFLLPAVSLGFALGTVFFVLFLSARLDRGMSNVTIVLVGMVVSLFCNAMMSLLATASPSYAQRIQLWQLGSFSMREWSAVWALLPIVLLAGLYFLRYAKELDVMTFGEEQAVAMGVDLRRVKGRLMTAVAVLIGVAVAFVGIIGFVDLIVPHAVRRFFGAAHRKLLPACALAGGTFLVLCDLAARTLTPPHEIPIGSITALLGAPFFLYLFFAGRRND